MVSVIVPVYNIEKYIEKCILSVIEQTYTDFELLLINDGSTDSSYQICKQWANKDPRVKVFSQNNSGVSSARNWGLELAQGEYICFVDGDDWLDPSFLEKTMSKMTDDIDLVVTNFQAFLEDGTKIAYPKEPPNRKGICSVQEAVHDAFHSSLYIRVVWGRLFKRKVLNNIRFRPLAYTEDSLAMFEALDYIKNIYIFHEPLYLYLSRSTSATHNITLSQYESASETFLFIYNKALECYPEFIERSSKSLLSHYHRLLTMYAQLNQTEKAFELIGKMKTVYKTANIQQPSLANRILAFPKLLIYLYAKIKSIIKTR